MSTREEQRFLWGAATAAYQIEGAVREDGRGQSIWDTFSHTPGRTRSGDTGDIACDHYHRWREDLDLLEELGVGSYRFSIAWPRILPEGTGKVNGAGLDHYERLVDALLERDVAPAVTLYHWDLPQALQDRGGWVNRESIEWFAEYTEVVTRRLGDRVPLWITVNEPWVVAFLGHGSGVFAPGTKDGPSALRAAHHLLLGHAAAVEMLRRDGTGEVGITVDLVPAVPYTGHPDDTEAAERFDGGRNRWFLEPLLEGRYPADAVKWYGKDLDGIVQPGDLEKIRTPLDFLGVNYYRREYISAVPVRGAERYKELPDLEVWSKNPDGLEETQMGWAVEADGLRDLLVGLGERHPGLPLYVTENGAAYPDTVGHDGEIHDPERTEYLRSHVRAVLDARAAGTDVRGYYCWSLLDNFEWAQGYSRRFGLYHVDYQTLERRPKDSAHWYSMVARGEEP